MATRKRKIHADGISINYRLATGCRYSYSLGIKLICVNRLVGWQADKIYVDPYYVAIKY